MTTQSNAAGQTWSPQAYASDAGFVPALGRAVFDLLNVQAGERVLDLGCGDGVLTVLLVQHGASVVGVDASPEMIEAAKARGIDARVADAHALAFDAQFDAVFSNAALHWMRKPEAVLAGVRRALKPGGRFVGEFGGHGNVAAIVTALSAALHAHGLDIESRFPWFFPTVAEYSALLQQHGFRVDANMLVPRPTPLPTGIEGWMRAFASPFLTGLDDSLRKTVLDEAIRLLAFSLRDQSGQWTADYVRLRFKATSL
jgi:trans-aconitate methyltransferase